VNHPTTGGKGTGNDGRRKHIIGKDEGWEFVRRKVPCRVTRTRVFTLVTEVCSQQEAAREGNVAFIKRIRRQTSKALDEFDNATAKGNVDQLRKALERLPSREEYLALRFSDASRQAGCPVVGGALALMELSGMLSITAWKRARMADCASNNDRGADCSCGSLRDLRPPP
jgi:hypothetical protein